MQKIIFLLSLFFPVFAQAACPVADSFFERGMNGSAVAVLQVCAINYNDDVSQMQLAQLYKEGKYGLKKDINQEIYYYQLASEAGNAEAQLVLAELLMRADKTPETRDELIKYRSNLENVSSKEEQNSFKGDFLHPYALLMLASEAPDKKWYYPSQVRSAPAKAVTLYKTYKITDEGKRVAMRQASQFKTRKLLQTAKEVYSNAEYPDISDRLKNTQTQKQALIELKQKMEEYIQNKNKIRKAK